MKVIILIAATATMFLCFGTTLCQLLRKKPSEAYADLDYASEAFRTEDSMVYVKATW